MTRIFFATDIHGSDICWRKFLNAGKFYQANVLVLGGDMTGKALVPIVRLPGGTWKATLLQQEFILKTESDVSEMERRVSSRGYYPFHTTPDQLTEFAADPTKLDQFFNQQIAIVLERWLALADERLAGSGRTCFVCPGNDDALEIDALVRRSKHVTLAEGRAVPLGDGFSMISTGWANLTPWHTFREQPEPALAARIAAMLPPQTESRRTVFNFHCPPYDSGLDDAPQIDADLNIKDAGRALVPVGSTAVRDAILHYQPLLSLHGHIHESKGVVRLGQTVAINAGSAYEQGVLQGVLVELDARKGIRNYTLTTG